MMIDRIVDAFGQNDAYPAKTPMVENANTFLKRPLPDEQISEDEKAALAKLPYRSLIGQLLYPSLGSRPDICYVVRKLLEFLDCYRRSHWDAAIRVVCYLKGTQDLHLRLGGGDMTLRGFTDSSWGDCQDGCRSSMGYCYTMGSGMISWSARKQKVVATSSTEAEYIAASESCKEAIWLRSMLTLLPLPETNHPDSTKTSDHTTPGKLTTALFCDNNGAVCLALNPQFHSRTKHFDIRYHYIRQCIENGEIAISRVPTNDNVADIFTKPLAITPFMRFRELLGLC